ncbi:MAG: type II secretion system F family protein [Planctomycetota bacterium]
MPVLHIGGATETDDATRAPAPGAALPPAPTTSAAGGANVRLRSSDLELFTRNLHTQVSAGVPLLRALEQQAKQDHQPALAKLSQDIAVRIEGGSSLAEALQANSKTFSSIYINLVHAGEFAGQLDQMLAELASFLAWRGEIKKTLKQASVYPGIVITATIGLVVFVVAYLFPKFGKLFDRLGDEIPPHVQFLLDTGNFVAAHWPMLTLGAGAALAAVMLTLRTVVGRRWAWNFIARLPIFGRVHADLDLAILMRNLAVLESAGIPLVHALELSRESVRSPASADGLQRAADDVMGGDTFATAVGAQELLPPMALNMVSVGEESGRLADVFQRLADHYDQESKAGVTRFLAFLEPAITLMLGLFVAGVAVTVISTLYQVIRATGR